MYGCFILCLFCFLLKSTTTIESKSWIPFYENESTFNEPYDFVDVKHLPKFEYGDDYDWISIAGTSLTDLKNSYVIFTGTRNNNDSSYNSVYRKQSGIIVLCSSNLNSTLDLEFDFVCQKIEEKSLAEGAKFFGAIVRSTKYNKDSVAFVYCDPLWVNTDSHYNEPSGKCTLSLIKNLTEKKNQIFTVCDKFRKCLGGFSVDIISINQELTIMFGLPFENSTITLNQAESSQINKGVENKGYFFNFGYSVAFSGDGSQYISSPINDGYSPFVKMVNGEKFYPTDVKSQSYGGFGTSLDTVRIGNDLYGVVIGAPYQSKQNLANIGAVYLACKGNPTDVIFGENANDYFGYSVARLGDINSDGPEEFVVSAPSLNLDKPGKIYIYKTTSNCKISKLPLQVYQSKMNGFGIAISRGFDINFDGMPDFFVTALGYQTPFLFKMPRQEKVICSWFEQGKDTIYTQYQIFDVKVIFNSQNSIDFSSYIYQVAIDVLNKGETRFKLNTTKLEQNNYIIKLQALQDVQDMDLKATPLQIAVKGVRKCKINSESCYIDKTAQVKWSNCERSIKLLQHTCNEVNCESNLNLEVKSDHYGSEIYYGEQKYYQRNIEVIVNNQGPSSTSRVYMSILSKPDLLIHNVDCSGSCKKELTATGQNAKIIIKETLEKWESDRDNFSLNISVLYNKLENVSATTSISFYISGVNDDNYMKNNNFTMTYSILFKPNLIFSPKKTKETIIDSRTKEPYLEKLKRIPVHELGTELQYSYLIENKGPELKNVELKFYFPFKTQSNEFILYVMDKIRLSGSENWISVKPSISDSSGKIEECFIPKDVVNPLEIIGVEPHNHHSNQEYSYRMKRSINNESPSSNFTFESPMSNPSLQTVSSTDRNTIINCGETSKKLGIPICREVTCKLKVIPTNSEFTFNFRTWLFTKTFFKARIADISVITTLQSNLGDLPKSITIFNNTRIIGPIVSSQNVLFNKMKVSEDKTLPLWPIIVAIIIGIFILVIIIVIAYYCGFFKRKRLRKEKQKQSRGAETKPLNANQ